LEVSGVAFVFPRIIDDSGRVSGNYIEASGKTINAIDVNGTIISEYLREEGGSSGCYRLKDGTLETFNPPRSKSTFPTGINAEGKITGNFVDGHHLNHGFVRINP
jgi:hypothetical protein